MKVLIIGYGNMGKTYANSFISSRFIKPEDIFVLVRNDQYSISENGIPKSNFSAKAGSEIGDFDIVILAVKPQDFTVLAQAVEPFLKDTQIIFSVMADITIVTIEKQLTRTKILCSMPNIPTQIGMGIIVFTASATEDRKELFIIQNLIKIPVENQFI